jgi:hypothetical protein
MDITKVTADEEGLVVESDIGQMLIGGKRYFLEAGVTMLFITKGPPEPKVVVPSVDGSSSVVLSGTTDPQLVCLARRGWSAHQMVPMPDEFPVPTVGESTAELASGQDVNGEPWPVPRLPAVPLEEALAAAKKEGN